MNVQIATRGVARSRELEDQVGRRTYFALGRFANRISQVRVRLTDVNGPRGGLDTRCAVTVHVPRMPPIFVDEIAESASTAVDIAMDRAGRVVSRRIDRALDRRRGACRAA